LQTKEIYLNETDTNQPIPDPVCNSGTSLGIVLASDVGWMMAFLIDWLILAAVVSAIGMVFIVGSRYRLFNDALTAIAGIIITVLILVTVT